MSHHSDKPYSDLLETPPLYTELERIKREVGLGATGQFPRGKISEEDQGEIKLAIAADRCSQTIILNFGKSIEWIGFTADQCAEIEATLFKKRMELRGIV